MVLKVCSFRVTIILEWQFALVANSMLQLLFGPQATTRTFVTSKATYLNAHVFRYVCDINENERKLNTHFCKTFY